MARARIALDEYADLDQDTIDYIVKNADVAALDQHGQLAQTVVAETGRGVSRTRRSRASSPASRSPTR